MSVALFAALLSALPLTWLAWRDPKRMRVSGRRDRAPLSSRIRGLLTLCVLALGGVLAFYSAAAVLIWLGAVTTVGWAISEGLAPRR